MESSYKQNYDYIYINYKEQLDVELKNSLIEWNKKS